MRTNKQPLLCRYQYDPVDRLVDCTPSAQAKAQRFYQKNRLITEIQGLAQCSIMQHEDQLLAQQQRQGDALETSLLATDHQRSVLTVLDESGPRPITHTPYGYRPLASGLLSLLGFNGERPDPVTGCYLLGYGYRAFSPLLMRFNSPDSWSPFGKGGLNAYAYCVGDPLNRADHTGRYSIFPKGLNPFKGLRNMLGLKKPSSHKKQAFPDGKVMVGHHGTSSAGAKNILENGADFDFIGSNTGSISDGFYVSKDLELAQSYARDHLQKTNRAVVLEVYVENLKHYKPGADYIVGTGGKEGEITFLPHMYDALSFKRHGSFIKDHPHTYRPALNQEIRSAESGNNRIRGNH